MMRVTNSMMVKRTKSNINANRAKVDYTNNQMSTQKKITKPSDDPIIAIRSLRLRSTLSTITQYYHNNISDAESWMDCTGTALKNMKDLLDDAYSRVVHGTTDELQPEDRETILKALQSLQQQVYCEGNADYARRSIFTGFKTNESLTFMSNKDAKEEEYDITERFDYQDIDKKNYYPEAFDDTSDGAVATNGKHPDVFNEVELNRIRLAYDKISADGNSLSISYKDGDQTVKTVFNSDGSIDVGVKDGKISASLNANGNLVQPPNITHPKGFHIDEQNPVITPAGVTTGTLTYTYNVYTEEDWNGMQQTPPILATPVQTAKVVVTNANKVSDAGDPADAYLSASIGTGTSAQTISYRVSNTADLKAADYKLGDNEIVFDQENGELLFNDSVADALDATKASITFDYHKKGFEEGELRPEYYFDCTRYMKDRDNIVYENFDENGNWKTQAIYYNIAGGQQMQINTEGREVFNSDIRRDMDDLIDIVNAAISAQKTVDDIKIKIESGNYKDEELESLNKWYDAAKKQLDYANQNMHDTYSSYISRFQGYLDTVNLEITDLGGRGERVDMTKSRMSVQESTFKELKSINEDMDLSELVINYTAASVSYQAALQAAAKIGKMTLLDFL